MKERDGRGRMDMDKKKDEEVVSSSGKGMSSVESVM